MKNEKRKKSTYHKKSIKNWQFKIALSMYKDGIAKMIILLGNALETVGIKVPKLSTEKWKEFHGQLLNASDRCKPSKQIRFKMSILQLDLCDYNDAYIVVKGTSTVTGENNL